VYFPHPLQILEEHRKERTILLLWVIKWLTVLVLIVPILSGRLVEASVNLPLHHWVYSAIERLHAMNVIDRAMIGPKPYSRKEAARYVARAIKRIRSNQVLPGGWESIAEILLNRLLHELRPELISLGAISAPGEPKSKKIRHGIRLRQEVGGFSIEEGDVRFRENRGGEYYADGVQSQTDLRGWIEFGDILALSVNNKFYSDADSLGLGNSTQVENRELIAKLSAFNIALEVGRGSLWWGPGYHGALLLTNHAFPLDLIKLESDEPFRLPWVFRSWGEWKINSFLTRLERDRDFRRANVFGLRVSFLPTNWLELGFSRLTQYGGHGQTGNISFPKTIFEVYTKSLGPDDFQDVDLNTNDQSSLDLRIRIPRVPYLIPFPTGMQFYYEMGSEDAFPGSDTPAILVGLYIPQVFPHETIDLRIEYADTDLTRRTGKTGRQRVWYGNNIYVTGLRFKGQPLGHHMGTDAIDVFVRATRFFTDRLQLGMNFNHQERDRGEPGFETKREAAIDLSWWITSDWQFQLGYTYQRIKNPGQVTSINPFVETFASGVTSNNHLLWGSLTVEF